LIKQIHGPINSFINLPIIADLFLTRQTYIEHGDPWLPRFLQWGPYSWWKNLATSDPPGRQI